MKVTTTTNQYHHAAPGETGRKTTSDYIKLRCEINNRAFSVRC
jgi:hypothetical protein